jgi:uncharacterized protein (DUF983 family)
MLSKGSKLYSILRLKCPRCQSGKFLKGHPYNFSRMGEVKEECENCELKHNMEPGFFQGSFYVSYGLGVALFVSIFVLKMLFLPHLSYLSTIILMVVTLLILSPLLFALSKIIWINLFVNYDANFNKKEKL